MNCSHVEMRAWAMGLMSLFGGATTHAQNAEEISLTTELAPFTVTTELGLNDEPALGLATPVTQLRFAQGVDLQSRGYAELQSDITVRGATFEQTGVMVGSVPLFDPQTGHYTAELPFSGEMLRPPQLMLGFENALRGFNSNVATIQYDWAPIESRGKAVTGMGTDALIYGELYQGIQVGDSGWAYDVSIGHGEGDGTVANGDFDVWRGAARVQHRSTHSQTDLAVGWLDKFYGWPGLYTGYASLPEKDDFQNLVVLIHHRQSFAEGSFWSIGGGFRQMDDDYYYNRLTPPEARTSLFEHLTRVGTLAGEGRWVLDEVWSIKGRAIYLEDEIVRSTSLTNGDPSTGNDFTEHSYGKIALGVAASWNDGGESVQRFELGFAGTVTDEDSGRISPLIRWERISTMGSGDLGFFAEYTEAAQLPGYTALRSAPKGLFGGNPNLGRELSRVTEIGTQWESGDWFLRGSVFYRRDDELVDWTFDSSLPGIRQANPLDLETKGVELEVRRVSEWSEVRVSYAWLEKTSDYGSARVNASFYVLNFPVHRFTAGAKWRPVDGLELAGEGEYRVAEPNGFRTTGDRSLLVSVALRWLPWSEQGLEFNLLIDNLTGEDFEEFPGTPAVGRHGSLRAVYRW